MCIRDRGPGRDSGTFEQLPGRFQQQPLLRVHRGGLPRADAEEIGVEPVGVVQEAALPGVRGAGPGRAGVVERVEVPASVGGEAADRVGSGQQQVPEPFRGVGSSRPSAAHRDQRDRLVVRRRPGAVPGGPGGPFCTTSSLGQQEPCDRERRGMVEGDGGRHRESRHGRQPVAQLHRAEGVEPEVPEREVGGHGDPVGIPEDGRRRGEHEVEHPAAPLLIGKPGEPRAQRAGGLRLRLGYRGRRREGIVRGDT